MNTFLSTSHDLWTHSCQHWPHMHPMNYKHIPLNIQHTYNPWIMNTFLSTSSTHTTHELWTHSSQHPAHIHPMNHEHIPLNIQHTYTPWIMNTFLSTSSTHTPHESWPHSSQHPAHIHPMNYEQHQIIPWASYQIRKIAGCACAGNVGNVSPRRRFQRKPLVSDPGMHHGTCVAHVPWCMSGSLTCGDGENVPGIPGACAPAILRIWQEVHGLSKRFESCVLLCLVTSRFTHILQGHFIVIGIIPQLY